MKASVLALVLAAGLGVAGAAAAQDYTPMQAGHVTLDVRATVVDPTAGNPILDSTNTQVAGLNAEVNSNTIPSLGIRYFFTDNVSGELILGTSRHSIHAVNSTGTNLDVGRTWVLPPTATVQYNFNPHGRINPYVGAGVNYMLFYSERNGPSFANTHVRNGFGWALQAGADVAVGGRWSLNVDLKKIFFRTTATTTLLPGTALHSRVRLDPWVPSVGIGYRF